MSPSFTINSSDAAAGLTVSDSGRQLTFASGASYRGARSVETRAGGLVMATFWTDPMGAAWATDESSVGFANSSHVLTAGVNGPNQVTYSPGGKVWQNGGVLATYAAWQKGSRIDAVWDFGNSKVYFRADEGSWNNSGAANPATNTGGLSVTLAGTLYALISLYSTVDQRCRSALYIPTTGPVGITFPWG